MDNINNIDGFFPDDESDLKKLISEMGIDIEQLEREFANYAPKKELEYEVISDNAVEPKYAYESDSGFDLHSTIDTTIPPFGRLLVPTGLKFDIPNDFEIQIRPKSGLALKKGLTVLNTPGTIDCFSEDMKILTVDGEKKIEDLKINDILFSLNEKTLEIEKDYITEIFDTEEQEVYVIETEHGILEVTGNSDVYTNKGIILAKDLKIDDEIIIFF